MPMLTITSKVKVYPNYLKSNHINQCICTSWHACSKFIILLKDRGEHLVGQRKNKY